MTEAIFTATALTKTYVSGEVHVHALNNVDLDISEKEVVVLLGPSGSGKTTLLNIMGGLDQPTSGKLFFKDLELTGLNDREYAGHGRDEQRDRLAKICQGNPLQRHSAYGRKGEDWAVFVVEDERARLTPVKIGHRNNRMAEILEGLAAGRQVVLHPSDKIADGIRIAQR